MTTTQKNRVIELYKEGFPLDCIWSHESLEVVKAFRVTHWKRTRLITAAFSAND